MKRRRRDERGKYRRSASVTRARHTPNDNRFSRPSSRERLLFSVLFPTLGFFSGTPIVPVYVPALLAHTRRTETTSDVPHGYRRCVTPLWRRADGRGNGRACLTRARHLCSRRPPAVVINPFFFLLFSFSNESPYVGRARVTTRIVRYSYGLSSTSSFISGAFSKRSSGLRNFVYRETTTIFVTRRIRLEA